MVGNSTEPYKGVRDFYPEDWHQHTYLFNTLREVVERFGYEEYNASILEPTELYTSKTSEEIVNEQTYSFRDRGDREVTLRPEMTPSVARMVAARQRELTFPLRWYSVPNVFRYERPQRGRLREHWQLNVDLFGVEGVLGDAEIIEVAHTIMTALGAESGDFVIRINNRKLLNALFIDELALSPETTTRLTKLIDRRAKMEEEAFETAVKEILDTKKEYERLTEFLSAPDFATCKDSFPKHLRDSEGATELESLLNILKERDIASATFDPSLVRGFDYYTGTVFEVFDTDPKNKRSLFGGGRYDGLTEIFERDPVPAVGFGMGDVTMTDFLEVRGLLSDYPSPADLYLCTVEPTFKEEANTLARTLREHDVRAVVDLSDDTVGDQVRTALKKNIPHIICIGEDEVKSDTYTIKELATSKETELSGAKEVAAFLSNE